MGTSLPPAATRMKQILSALEQAYPDAACSLHFTNPLELLIATILSAQCTDALVNKVTIKYHAFTGVVFYKKICASKFSVERFGGKVPDRMDDLIQLPGVARKTANVVLGNAFHIQAGIVVDTHVMRLSQRLGLSPQHDRDKIERDLMALVPQPLWTRFGHQMITHGRAICTAKAPRCADCPIGKSLCPSYTV